MILLCDKGSLTWVQVQFSVKEKLAENAPKLIAAKIPVSLQLTPGRLANVWALSCVDMKCFSDFL